MAGAKIFPDVADGVGASAGADRDSGAVMAPEVGQTWTDVGGCDRHKICVIGGDQEKADQEELAGGGTKTMGAEEIDTEVPSSEVAPHPDPGWQYVSWAGRVLQVQGDGGGPRAATTEAGNGVDDAHTGLSDANSDRTSLTMEVEFGAELAGSESRADVTLKDELVGIVDDLEIWFMSTSQAKSQAEEILAHLKAMNQDGGGPAEVAESSAGAISSEGLKEVRQPPLGDPDLDPRRAVLAGLTAKQV
jgi:hypothetical protein